MDATVDMLPTECWCMLFTQLFLTNTNTQIKLGVNHVKQLSIINKHLFWSSDALNNGRRLHVGKTLKSQLL